MDKEEEEAGVKGKEDLFLVGTPQCLLFILHRVPEGGVVKMPRHFSQCSPWRRPQQARIGASKGSCYKCHCQAHVQNEVQTLMSFRIFWNTPGEVSP